MKRFLPPIHLLTAFTTTARFGSVSRASEALHLTQSAVSKQIQELEKQRDNQQLIRGNLAEEVALYRKEVHEMNEKRRSLEDFITKNLK